MRNPTGEQGLIKVACPRTTTCPKEAISRRQALILASLIWIGIYGSLWTRFCLPAHVGVDWDEEIYTAQAYLWTLGQIPYRDTWENKPPGTLLVKALVFRIAGDHAELGLRVVWLLAVTCAAGLLFVIACRLRNPRAAVLTVLAFAVLTSTRLNWFNLFSLHAEHLGHIPGAIIVLWALGDSRRGRWLGCAGCGLVLGYAVLMRQNYAVLAIPMMMGVWLAARDRAGSARAGLASFLRGTILFGVCACVPATLAAAYFAANGALNEAWFCVVQWPRWFVASGLSPERALVAYAGAILRFVSYHPVFWAAAAAMTARTIMTRRATPGKTATPGARAGVWWVVVAWLVVSLAQWPFTAMYDHYLVPCMAPLALLAGAGLEWLTGLLRRSSWGDRVACVVLAGSCAFPLFRHRGIKGYVAHPEQPVVEAIRQHTDPDARIAVCRRSPLYFYWARRRTALPDIGTAISFIDRFGPDRRYVVGHRSMTVDQLYA